MAFHESGHALAGLATCAHITSVEIDPELGGLTQMRGGIRWITLPAGAETTPAPVRSHAATMPDLFRLQQETLPLLPGTSESLLLLQDIWVAL